MSLTLGTAAVIGMFAPSFEEYLTGCDVLGAPLVGTDAKAESKDAVVQVHTGSYWTSVAAGLTVAAMITTVGYAYTKCRGRRHDFDGVLGRLPGGR